ncbi:MAG: long-chain fatty acid--CoA ligase [Rhodothermales bacterium]|nr:long-chain fatty acid--CoA ligase [Rhodothermales bacterium]MBO6780121.1 long-chain fatty acid--CoA ligase [Rhodothermales bacterium]
MKNSIPRQFLAWADRKPSVTAYAVKEGDGWKETSWSEYVREVRETARAFMSLGLAPGGVVAIMGFNRPQWTISDLAAMAAGGAPVGIYNTCSEAQVEYILGHSEAHIVVVELGEPLEKVLAVRDRLPNLRHVVVMDGDDEHGTAWAELPGTAASVNEADLDARLDAITEDALGTLIYTSGTTGPPKGVALSHGNLTEATKMGRELLPPVIRPDARVLSYLPMAHAAERAITLLGASSFGYAVYYAESIERMPANLVDVQPDMFLGVPRVWEKIHAGLTAKLAQATGNKARIAAWSRKVGLDYHRLNNQSAPIPLGLKLKYGVAYRLLFSRIRKALGLSRAEALLSGAAPIALDVLEDLGSLDLPLREVYGQTEGSGPTSNNRHGEIRWGSVGRPFHGVEVRIADDGEIVLRGPNVFQGYYKDPAATAEVLIDGWLHSGDLGHVDEDGYLYVTGRKKEILVTAGGKNITPRNIEEGIKAHPLVNEAVVIGDRRRFLSALITLDPEAEVGKDQAKARIWEHVEKVNSSLSNVEQIKKILVLPDQLTVDNGALTPTMKLRRSVIADRYAGEIDALYA